MKLSYNPRGLIDESTTTRMIMKFSLMEWRRLYDKVHEIGKTLNDSRPTYTKRGDYIAPLTKLSKEEQQGLEIAFKSAIKRYIKYLDYYNYRPKKPLWRYDPKDKTTHASSPEFKYGHLML